MNVRNLKCFACSMSAVFLSVLPAFGQQMGQQQPKPNQQTQRERQAPPGQMQQQNQKQQQQAAQGQTQEELQVIAFGLEPITRIAVTYDFDDDGEIDAIDYVNPNLPPVFIVDQRQAGRQDSQLSAQQRTGRQGLQSAGKQAGMAGGQSTQGIYKLQGTVQDVRTAKMAGSNEKRTFALVKTQKGKDIAVDLGPQWKVNQLALKKGDQISAFGRIGQVDERPVLNAFNVRSGDQRITIPSAQTQTAQNEANAKRYNVTVLNTRTVNIPSGPSVVMSKVQLPNGATTLVNLGPSNALSKLNLQANREIQILARSARIAGQQALIAERVAVGDQQVDIDWNQVRAGQMQQGASPG